MIISVSRRTDIPAFYSEWLMRRLDEGYALVRQPYNPDRYTRVDLSVHAVDAIVFCTRNPRPLLPHLDAIEGNGYRYYFQFTVNGYPGTLETSNPPLDEALNTFKDLSRAIGRERVIWRFDPILISSISRSDETVERFDFIARSLAGFTGRVVISFADFYKKTVRNLSRLTREKNIAFVDVHGDEHRLRGIAARLARTAARERLEIVTCAEASDLSDLGIRKGKCVDDELINRLYGTHLNVRRAANQRRSCGCAESRDIGQYDTCLNGCVYCYATWSRASALKNRARHDASSPLLIGRPEATVSHGGEGQLPLFQ